MIFFQSVRTRYLRDDLANISQDELFCKYIKMNKAVNETVKRNKH